MNELRHYGIKGMKWGVRKKSYNPVKTARKTYKSAKRDYSKALNEAESKSSDAYSPIKKRRQANDKRWADAADKAKTLDRSIGEYKKAKAQAKYDRVKVKRDAAASEAEKRSGRGDATDAYFEKTKQNTNMRRAGMGAKVAGTVLNRISKTTYNMYKDNGGPYAAKVVTGTYYAGKALNTIGNAAIIGSYGKQYRDYREWRDS